MASETVDDVMKKIRSQYYYGGERLEDDKDIVLYYGDPPHLLGYMCFWL